MLVFHDEVFVANHPGHICDCAKEFAKDDEVPIVQRQAFGARSVSTLLEGRCCVWEKVLPPHAWP
jgi:hypothetical protein